MSSRLGLDGQGRKVVIVTACTDGLPIGYVFTVVDWNGFFIPRGRPPTPQEMLSAGAPYDSTAAKQRRARPEVDDNELDDVQAIEFARRERQRQGAHAAYRKKTGTAPGFALVSCEADAFVGRRGARCRRPGGRRR
jgi:hypothetical protein